MDAEPCRIDGAVIFRPTVHHDARGWFVRTFDADVWRRAGIETPFVQQNQSRSTFGVLRGVHVRGGRGEAKMVRVSAGRVVDFMVDLRPHSRTFMVTERVELDDVGHVHLYLPPFVAHGYQVVSPIADLAYMHSRPYEPGEERTLRWDDPALGLDWPVQPPIVAPRDGSAALLADVDPCTWFDFGSS